MQAREAKKREELRAHHVATCTFDSVVTSIDPSAPDAPAFFARASKSHRFAAWRRSVERLDLVAFRCGDDMGVFIVSDWHRRPDLGIIEWDFIDATKWPAARALIERAFRPAPR